jgi:hypothetical protein
MPHKFEKRPPTVQQYTEAYERWSEELRKNFQRIEDSSECRKYLVKNAKTAPMVDLLKAAVNCIYDLTGDSQFRRQVIEDIERRQNESN